MKVKLFSVSLLATALLCGCSNDETAIDINKGDLTGEPQYLAVNLVTTGEAASKSRAAGDQMPGDPDGNKTYEEGLEDENQVTNIRFYFFNGDNAANVRKDGANQVNYLDWVPTSTEDPDMPKVEKILSATLILQTPEGDEMPETMVAIVNPTSDLPKAAITLTELKDRYGNYAKNNTEAGEFVMSNSTYASATDELMMEVDVKDNIMTSKAAALDKPVDVYVERTVAKIRVTCSEELVVAKTLDNGVELYDPSNPNSKDEKENNQKFGDKKIYVKFLGWNATAAADNSRLIKKINTAWDGKMLGDFGPWNWSAYCRSFWACNVSPLDYQYGAFQSNTDPDNLFQAQAQTGFDKKKNWVYLNENACDDAENAANGTKVNTPSKVIIAAQLVDETGKEIEFAEYGSTRYTVDELTKLFADNSGLYKKITNGYEKIKPTDLTIKTATELELASESVDGRYKVYIQLSDDAEKIDWYPSNGEAQTDKDILNVDKANLILRDLGSAKVWKSGYTYYYFNIDHAQGSKVISGVVRNHIYDAAITSLVGLGTPVYNPDEIIYPERPEPETDTYLAARINILSWRVVKNDVSLIW